MIFRPWRSIEAQREALLKKANNQEVKLFLAGPLPNKRSHVLEVEYLSLDFETTGLNPREDVILSVGYTIIRQGRILLKESGHHIIRIDRHLPDKSVALHQITHERMLAGEALSDVLAALLRQLSGKALLVHCAAIERPFLKQALVQVYGIDLPQLWVDTLEIERRRLDRGFTPVQVNRLRLANLRRDYKLPRYGAHNALEDAIATAELYLVLMAHRKQRKVLLRDVLC